MDQLVSILKDFWPQVITVVIATLVGMFHKLLKAWIVKLVHLISKKINATYNESLNCPGIAIHESLRKIELELRPNGGCSLRDAVNKIDKNVASMAKTLSLLQVGHDILSDTLNICRWAADEHGMINFVNRPLKQLIGAVDNDCCFGENWQNTVLKEDRDDAIKEWKRAVASKSEYHHTYRIVHFQTGKVITVTSHARTTKNINSGRDEGWVGVVIPHTEK